MPPFHYEPYVTPFANTIGEMMREQGMIRAAAVQREGDIQARADELRGQAWSGAASGAALAAGAAVSRIADPRRQLESQQLESGALTLAEQKRTLAERDTLQRIYRGAYGGAPSQQPGFEGPTEPGDPPAGSPATGSGGLPPGMTKAADGTVTFDRGFLTQSMAAAGLGDRIPATIAELTKVDEATATLAKTRGEVALQTRDALGALGKTVEQAVGPADQVDPAKAAKVFHLAAMHALMNGTVSAQQLGPYLDRVDADPTQAVTIAQELQAGSPKQTELNTAAQTAQARQATADVALKRYTAEYPKLAAQGAEAVRTNASGLLGAAQTAAEYTRAYRGLPVEVAEQFPAPETWTPKTADAVRQLGMTPAQQSEAGNRVAQLKVEAEKFAETMRHNKEGEEGVSLTEPARKKLSEYFATTGLIPPLGMGKAAAAMRKQIIEGAAAEFPNVTIASNAAQYKANKDSLKNVTQQLDTLTGFETAAQKNLDQFLALADKLPDTGVPILNAPLRLLTDRLMGSPELAATRAAADVAKREIARVTNGLGQAGLTDSARHEVAGLIGDDATIPQIKQAAQILKRDMANVHSSLADQRDAITARIAPTTTAAPAPPAAAAPTEGQAGVVNGVPAVWKTVNGKAGWYAK